MTTDPQVLDGTITIPTRKAPDMAGRAYRTGSHTVTLDRIMAEQAKMRARDRAELIGNVVVLLLLLAVVVVGGWMLAPGTWLS